MLAIAIDGMKLLGKKEFTLLKMQEYGFWPKNLPTPYEKQENETKEEYAQRKNLIKEYEKIITYNFFNDSINMQFLSGI